MTSKRELRLERFQTTSIDCHKFVSILCTEGKLWITAGKGFNDIVLRKDQHISLIASDKVVIEALASSHLFINHNLSVQTTDEARHN